MGVARISIGTGKKENLQELVNRYKILSEPQTVKKGLTYFTLTQSVKLYHKLITDPKHPKDTGLLKKSWIPPVTSDFSNEELSGKVDYTDFQQLHITPHFGKYKASLQSGQFNVYVLNTATVGKQALLKYQKEGWSHRKKKLIRRHNLKRYMPFVDERTGFYSKKLRVIKQELDKDWKKFVGYYIFSLGGGII